jgi:coatomer protein complex subunit gamma
MIQHTAPVTKSLFVSGAQVLVRMAFGIDASNNVAMKLVVRAESFELSEAVHQIIQDA